jgi:hypothetical protein
MQSWDSIFIFETKIDQSGNNSDDQATMGLKYPAQLQFDFRFCITLDFIKPCSYA